MDASSQAKKPGRLALRKAKKRKLMTQEQRDLEHIKNSKINCENKKRKIHDLEYKIGIAERNNTNVDTLKAERNKILGTMWISNQIVKEKESSLTNQRCASLILKDQMKVPNNTRVYYRIWYYL